MSLSVNQLGRISESSSQFSLSSNQQIKLDEIDPYSLDSLQDILDQRHTNLLEFSVVVIEEGNHQYFVEASCFLEQ